MAWATIKGVRHRVVVVADFPNLWAVELHPPTPQARKTSEVYKPWPVPLILKLYADSAAHALVFGLEHLKSLQRIEEFHVDENEKPPPPAVAPAPAKPAAP